MHDVMWNGVGVSQPSDHEEVKDWVLAVSMDQKAVRELPHDDRDTYEASLTNAHTGSPSLPCVITGEHITRLFFSSLSASRALQKGSTIPYANKNA